jgi:hypothetical protein
VRDWIVEYEQVTEYYRVHKDKGGLESIHRAFDAGEYSQALHVLLGTQNNCQSKNIIHKASHKRRSIQVQIGGVVSSTLCISRAPLESW